MKQRDAFTVTELLVLVPVAAVLTTMLFALSNDAKQQLQAAACLGNMRLWGQGLMLYANDHNDYFPYNGQPGYVCGGPNTNAWFNIVPPYIGQKSLCQLYTAGTPPTPLTKSLWSCPSATNITVQPTLTNLYFMYSMSMCWHKEGSTRVGFQRNRMTSPASTILFCEEVEDNFPTTNGKYDMVTRHFGGSNFVFGDGHADWIALTNFCRADNPQCIPPLSNYSWDNSGPSGDWAPGIPYHWWPFKDANTASY
jgi:prepilin-type processing-associated H-X9-DG protein